MSGGYLRVGGKKYRSRILKRHFRWDVPRPQHASVYFGESSWRVTHRGVSGHVQRKAGLVCLSGRRVGHIFGSRAIVADHEFCRTVIAPPNLHGSLQLAPRAIRWTV